jgi:hypothetical protein
MILQVAVYDDRMASAVPVYEAFYAVGFRA